MITFNEYQEIAALRSDFRTEVLNEVYQAIDCVRYPELLEERTAEGFNYGFEHFKAEFEKALGKIEQ